MCCLSINIPDHIAHTAGVTEKYLRESLAINMYDDGLVTLNLGAQIAEMSVEEFMILLGKHKISIVGEDWLDNIDNELSYAQSCIQHQPNN